MFCVLAKFILRANFTNMYKNIHFFLIAILATSGLFFQGCQEDPPPLHGVDLSHRDLSVSAADDFFRHSNGKWINETEIPASQSSWGSFIELIENNSKNLHNIMEEVSAEEHEKGSIKQIVGDYYYSGMDSASRETAGLTPIQDELALVEGLEDIAGLSDLMAQLHLKGISGFFRATVRADQKNSIMNASYLYQGGLGLPDRDYYLSDNPRFEAIRKGYRDFITTCFTIMGEDEEGAQNAVDQVMNIETRLATISRTRLALRDNEKNYNKMSFDEADALFSKFNLTDYRKNIGIPEVEYVIVGQPEFFEGLDQVLTDFALDDMKTYLKWKIIAGNASRLTFELEQASFDFFSKTLRGVPEMQPRWKRMSLSTNGALGEAVGQIYVERHFSPEAKEKVNEMVNNLRIVLEKRIGELAWMGDETKEQAQKKLKAITQKLGYPDKWKDYSKLEISRASYADNVMNVRTFEIKRRLAEIGQEVDKGRWGMSPPTVNAYYNPTNNEIVFPAGILQPPFFDPNAIAPVNYGAMGTVIGHEITHGFDDRGSGYDADGNLKNWWTEEDRSRFEERTDKIVEQYDAYTVLDSVHVNGKLTLGENIADLGGIAIAFEAMQLDIEKNGAPESFDGLTPEQQFFYSYANLWRGKYRDAALLQRIKTDSHSPGEFRVNGPLSNFQPFRDAFDVKEGNGMWKEELVEIW